MRIVIAPAAFKHSLSAAQAAERIRAGLQRALPSADLQLIPIADGGNGTLEAFLAQDGQRIAFTVEGPLGETVNAAYGLLPTGHTAVIEMALASGIELIPQGDALHASTYGTGQLMQAALDAGARRFIIGMGGSATVDGGAGCLQALGVRLLDAQNQDIGRGGGSLNQIAHIDTSKLDPRWHDTEVIIASDVTNPTLGPDGAAAVFGPQKGASSAQVQQLEANLRHFFTLMAEQLSVDVRQTPGGGAAGALAAGLMAVLSGRIESGIDLVLAHSRFTEHLQGADLVITGEGRMDAQTIYGKGPVGIAAQARAHGVPTVALVGALDADDALLHKHGLHAVLPIADRPMVLQSALARGGDLLEAAALRLGYLLALQGPRENGE